MKSLDDSVELCTDNWIFSAYENIVRRHTAREHLVEEKIIYYRFHPRCGEIVPILQRLTCHGVELVVILQPDGSVAQLPAWMTSETAAQYQIRSEPRFPLEIIRSLRTELDALLIFLQSDSMMEKAEYAAKNHALQKSSTKP